MLVGKLTDNVVSTQRGTSSVSMNLSWTLDMVPRTGSPSTRRGCSGRGEEKGCLKAGWVCSSSLHEFLPFSVSQGKWCIADRSYLAACDWWHGVPQLFWEFFFVPSGIPSACAQVQLFPVAV